jgi:hypothetical protein
MQNIAELRQELSDLRLMVAATARAVEVVPSPEPWNPIAAVELVDLQFPAGIIPSRMTVRIPLPDLYGFAASAAVGITESALTCIVGDATRRVPFCVAAERITLDSQRAFYSDVRAHSEELLGRYTVCVTPAVLPERFAHQPLPDFLKALMRFLANPIGAVQSEIERTAQAVLSGGAGAVDILRLAHLLDGVGEREEALRLLQRGADLFPENPWIKRQQRDLVQHTEREVPRGA